MSFKLKMATYKKTAYSTIRGFQEVKNEWQGSHPCWSSGRLQPFYCLHRYSGSSHSSEWSVGVLRIDTQKTPLKQTQNTTLYNSCMVQTIINKTTYILFPIIPTHWSGYNLSLGGLIQTPTIAYLPIHFLLFASVTEVFKRSNDRVLLNVMCV